MADREIDASKSPRPTVRLRPSSYQPSKAELEEDMRIHGATPDDLARAVMRTVVIETIEEED